MPKCDFNKVAYCNHTSAWVFSSKFAAYFQNVFVEKPDLAEVLGELRQ